MEKLKLAWRLLLDKRVSVWLKVAAVLPAAVYTIWPMDVIPDILLPFGIVDDVGVWVVAGALFVALVPSEFKESA